MYSLMGVNQTYHQVKLEKRDGDIILELESFSTTAKPSVTQRQNNIHNRYRYTPFHSHPHQLLSRRISHPPCYWKQSHSHSPPPCVSPRRTNNQL